MNVIVVFLALFLPTLSFAADDVEQLIAKAEHGLAKVHILEARFSQKTTAPFMDVPLESSGTFCFSIKERTNPLIFWEYQKPAVSGFFLENGNVLLWGTDGEHEMTAHEKHFLHSVIGQIMQWISFDPKRLGKTYEISRGAAPNSLRCIPKEKTHLFKAIELVLSETYDRLTQLKFLGQQDEETTLFFDVQSINQPLSDACRR